MRDAHAVGQRSSEESSLAVDNTMDFLGWLHRISFYWFPSGSMKLIGYAPNQSSDACGGSLAEFRLAVCAVQRRKLARIPECMIGVMHSPNKPYQGIVWWTCTTATIAMTILLCEDEVVWNCSWQVECLTQIVL